MGNAKAEKEELKKLEDEAYFELCQIIAEAVQLQDIELLDYRIASWKNKYKKLLDNPSPEFKKRIEYLLNEYYSSITQYIQSQIKFNENKKIENQSKALRELYVIIRDTDDLKTLEKKVNAWKEKYPKDKFLKMYQSKYEHMTSKRNLRENAFDQEMAFKDLVEITKHTGTFEEFAREREQWENKYSIHDKFELDDFIKHQSDIKRYTSDEYLHSISRDEEHKENNNSTTFETAELSKEPKQEEQPQKVYSDLAKQASAYTALLAISQKPNNVNEMFKWVYKNGSIKFNDKYKELILNATYLDYSPTYLNKLRTPGLNVNNKSLSYEEFKEMDDIKRYAIISYFNLLLPPDKAISNGFFNSCINTVYAKSEKAKYTNSSLNEINQENLKDGIEIKLSKSDAEQELDLPELKKQEIPDTEVEKVSTSTAEEKQEENIDSAKKLQEDLPTEPEESPAEHIKQDEVKKEYELVAKPNDEVKEQSKEMDNKPEIPTIQDNQGEQSLVKENNTPTIDLEIEEEPSKEELFSSPETSIEKPRIDVSLDNSFEEPVVKEVENVEPEPLQQEQIITVSPLLFSAINYKSKQADAVEKIDEHVNEYVLSSSKTISDNVQTKQKTDWD